MQICTPCGCILVACLSALQGDYTSVSTLVSASTRKAVIIAVLVCLQLKDMVRKQAAHDVDPPLGETASYIKNEMTKEGYRHLLAAGRLSTLGSPLSCISL